MNINEMAFEIALKLIERGEPDSRVAFDAYYIAEAMAAEAAKRNKKEGFKKNHHFTRLHESGNDVSYLINSMLNQH